VCGGKNPAKPKKIERKKETRKTMKKNNDKIKAETKKLFK
jgi:hypothetical protein